jgi:hypothetical protein
MKRLFSVFATALFLLASGIFFGTCQKEYSYEGGNQNGSSSGTAVYTLNGSGGSCIGSTVTGEYFADISLTQANTILLQVDVTTIGTYNLTTNNTNGIQFSAAGTFTNTGMQTITLTGSGTPVSVGSFTFTTPGSGGCSFTVEVNTAPVALADFTLAGAPNDCANAMVNGLFVAGAALTNANNVVVSVDVITIGAYTLTTDTIDGISFSKSGSFTNTGNQNVILIAGGTPNLPRNLHFTILSGTSHCGFDIAIQNPAPIATYVLESGFGNPSPCIYTLSGDYILNKPLTNSNTVSLHVFVTVIGNFTIATDTINGMIFSFTGSFTSLGAQLVTLTGSGTPLAQGTNTFIPEIVGPHPLGGQACAFVITIQ